MNTQLRASTAYIRSFVQDNQEAFNSLANLNNLLNSLVEYANVQATCYKDLKEEIENLKQSQIEAQSNGTKLNADLLMAVREMITAIKSMKN